MRAYAEGLGVEYEQWVTFYQSDYFKGEFPEENTRFANVVVTKGITDNLDLRLELLRHHMFTENSFDASIFAGGMRGIYDEYDMLTEISLSIAIIPIVSTGGAEAKLCNQLSVAEYLAK